MKDGSLRSFGSDTLPHGRLGRTDTDKAVPQRVMGGLPSVQRLATLALTHTHTPTLTLTLTPTLTLTLTLARHAPDGGDALLSAFTLGALPSYHP